MDDQTDVMFKLLRCPSADQNFVGSPARTEARWP